MKYHAVLAHFPKITYNRYRKLAAYFSDLKDLWQAEIIDLTKAGIEPNIANEFLNWRDTNPPEKIFENLEKNQIRTTSLGDGDYPTLLKEIPDPPHTIFYRGLLSGNDEPSIGIVGTRRMTPYGKLACEKITSELARQGIIIVSGLALGIDGVAHQTTLNANGVTIAVLGTGIDQATVYPSNHKLLAEKIIANGGALISEYPPGSLPTKYSFPERNRIIAGLSLGVLVIEAPEQSGALITARCALEYNREVFAIPHPINSITGLGPNNLIKMGAKLVTETDDIIEALNIKKLNKVVEQKKIILPATPVEARILAILTKEPTHINNIIKQTNLDSPSVGSALTLMEMKGKVRNVGGMMYILG